jgi:hypothetical protein
LRLGVLKTMLEKHEKTFPLALAWPVYSQGVSPNTMKQW